jgi:hypothetical protein
MYYVYASLQIGIVTERIRVRTSDLARTVRRLQRGAYTIRRVRQVRA